MHEKAEGETHGLGSMTHSEGPNHDECGEKSSLRGGWRVKAWVQSNRVLRKGLVGKVAKALGDEEEGAAGCFNMSRWMTLADYTAWFPRMDITAVCVRNTARMLDRLER